MVLPSPRGTRINTAPLVQDGSGSENDREVHSSPPVVSDKKEILCVCPTWRMSYTSSGEDFSTKLSLKSSIFLCFIFFLYFSLGVSFVNSHCKNSHEHWRISMTDFADACL